MKTINIHMENDEWEVLTALKGKESWKRFLLEPHIGDEVR